MALGARIRAARERSGLSLREFAGRAELSPGFVSQLERDLVDPSLESLRRIATVLGVPMFDLFADAGGQGPAVVRRGGRVRVTSPKGGISYARLSAGTGRIEVLEGLLDPHGSSSPTPWTHPSEECVTVISGRVRAEINGEDFILSEGDSCSFDSRLPHRYINDGDAPARFILAITPPSY
ncbi:MAG: XRE family transcriptional regulator [Acidobacteria bacterium]|nr:MAG: XRE family transcriptional regulator [Acidobacteriota bacterium]